ncbi:MAG: hypothetical protein EXR36_03455 [Betaproteobacteria bacterium]|nr:hypothetical protein [Betaproteobacteria bacterium]
MTTSALGTSFIRTGKRITAGLEELGALHGLARELCPGGFPAEETRELPALHDHIRLGFIDGLRDQIVHELGLPRAIFSRDRFSVHGCGPVGLHDDFFRFPYVYFVVVVAHSGRLGLVDETNTAKRHEVGEIILLDPRRKHGLVREGTNAAQHVYDQTHREVRDPDEQFLFLGFDVMRPDLRSRFRPR